MTAASLLVYWSSDPADGKQTGEIVDVKNTGDSNVRIAMSLYYDEHPAQPRKIAKGPATRIK